MCRDWEFELGLNSEKVDGILDKMFDSVDDYTTN